MWLVKFLQTSALLLQLVVETMFDAIIITEKKWLNEALTTQKLYRPGNLNPDDIAMIQSNNQQKLFKLCGGLG